MSRTPSVQTGVQPDLLLDGQYGHRLNFWDLRARKHTQSVDLGKEHQIALELRPAHDPTKSYGFANTVVSLNDLSANIFLWHRKDGANGAKDAWEATKVITIPAEPAEEDLLPPALKPFKAVPPLVTDIELSVDDRFLYVSCDDRPRCRVRLLRLDAAGGDGACRARGGGRRHRAG